jgi:RHS repeat-associated protein
MLGNWTEQRTDLTGNGVFTDALDRSDARAHNLANELTQRVVSPTAGGTTSTNSVTLPLAYDAAGNLEEESTSATTKRRYTHDAWGRLVKVESLDANNAAKPLSTHRFNGLHWRIEKHWHAVPDAADLADRKTTYWYDAAWRVVQETQRDQTNGAGTLEESIIQQVWGARYIDDAVARMRVTGNGSGGVAAGASQELAFQLTDAQFSVIAVATPGKPGVVIDRIAYSPYGEATRTLRSDVNGDGFVNKDDYAGIIKPRTGATIGTTAYVVEADLDRDGKITQTDYDISIADDGKSSSGGVGEAGLFSRGVRNSVGYCGYVFNEDSGLYTVRFRTYSPTLGRWLERDPAGYVDGMGLYEYVRGGAIDAVDPWGLWTGGLYAPPHGTQIYPPDPPQPRLPDRFDWGYRKFAGPTHWNSSDWCPQGTRALWVCRGKLGGDEKGRPVPRDVGILSHSYVACGNPFSGGNVKLRGKHPQPHSHPGYLRRIPVYTPWGFKVLPVYVKNPLWGPGYVDDELDQKEPRDTTLASCKKRCVDVQCWAKVCADPGPSPTPYRFWQGSNCHEWAEQCTDLYPFPSGSRPISRPFVAPNPANRLPG